MAHLTLLALSVLLLLAPPTFAARSLQQFAPNACNPFSDFPNQCYNADGSASICCPNSCPTAGTPASTPVCADGVKGVSPAVNTPNSTVAPAPKTVAPAPSPVGTAAPTYTGFPEFSATTSAADVSSYIDSYHPTLKFAVIGDVGRVGGPASEGAPQCDATQFTDNDVLGGQQQLGTAKLLGDVCNLNRCAFVVHTGDNFYECGVYPGDSTRLKTDIQDVYDPYASLNGLVWHSTLGNHDMVITGSMEQQMQFNNSQWYLPAANFYREFKANGVTVRAIFYDENPFIASYKGKGKYDKDWYNRHSNQAYSDAVVAFVNQSLATSTANHNILISHYPLFGTAVEYGRTASAGLFNLFPRIVALINQYKPVAFFNGHDHVLTLGAPGAAANGNTYTSYVTTGAGGTRGFSDSCGPNRQYTNGGAGGFVVCEATADTFTIRYYSTGAAPFQIDTENALCTVTSSGGVTTVGLDCKANLRTSPADGTPCPSA